VLVAGTTVLGRKAASDTIPKQTKPSACRVSQNHRFDGSPKFRWKISESA